jgi:hypothetical protein
MNIETYMAAIIGLLPNLKYLVLTNDFGKHYITLMGVNKL